MNKCPDKEFLEKFVEHELDDARNAEIFQHLTGCEKCKHIITGLIAEEERFIREVSAESTMKSKGTHKATGKCFTDTGLMAYAVKSLGEDQLKLVEKHLHQCDNCLSKLMTIQRKLTVPADLALDFSQFQPGKIPAVAPALVEIVLKAKNDMLDLVKHSGELLALTPQYAVVRGEQRKAEESIAIRHDLAQQDLSIEITIQKKLSKTGAIIIVSLMRLSTEEFLAGKNVRLISDDATYARETDDEGTATFSSVGKVKYEINVDDQRVGSLTII